MLEIIRRFIVLPALLVLALQWGFVDLEAHVWFVLALPIGVLAFVTYMAIKQTPIGEAYRPIVRK
jgi:hypothetical protein